MANKLRSVLAALLSAIWLAVPLLGASCLTYAALPPTEPAPTANATAVTLENTYWKLLSLRGQAIAVAEKKREPYLILQTARQQLMGSSGCNRLQGNYKLDGEQLTFERTAGTMMACKQGMEQERDFLDLLAAVKRWRIAAQQLELLDANGEVIAVFEPRYL